MNLIFIVLLVIVFVHEGTSTGLNREKVCNNPSQYGFVQRKDTNKYYLVADVLLNWFEGEMLCQSKGAHLPSVEDLEENIYLRELVKDFTKLSSDIEYGVYWLGGYLSKPSNTWKWSDGKPFEYTNWKVDQPNDNEDIEKYITDYYGDSSFIGWNDSPKEEFERAVVCKLECDINMPFVSQIRNIEKVRDNTDNYSEYKVKNTKFLTLNGFRLRNNTGFSEFKKGERCWNVCLEINKCFAAGQNKSEDYCLLYATDFYGHQENDYVSIFKSKWDSVNHAHILQSVRLFGHYIQLKTIKSSDSCWNICKLDKRCLASMHRSSDNMCFLHDYNLTITYQEGWSTYFKELL